MTINSNSFSKPLMYFWNDMVLYIGPLEPNVMHSFVVPTLSADLSKDFCVSDDDGETWLTCRSVFWPALYPHRSIYKKDIMAFLIMEPVSQLCYSIQENMLCQHNGFFYRSKNQDEMIQLFKSIYQYKPSSSEAKLLVNNILCGDAINSTYKNTPLDWRVKKVIEKIKTNISQKHSTEELAEYVGFSKIHLMQLFKKQSGMTIGRFQLWQKVIYATIEALQGKNMAMAAAEAGFSDAAHFSRVFKEILGVTPTNVLIDNAGVDCVIE